MERLNDVGIDTWSLLESLGDLFGISGETIFAFQSKSTMAASYFLGFFFFLLSLKLKMEMEMEMDI